MGYSLKNQHIPVSKKRMRLHPLFIRTEIDLSAATAFAWFVWLALAVFACAVRALAMWVGAGFCIALFVVVCVVQCRHLLGYSV